MTEAARRRTRARIRLIKIQWLLILALIVALILSFVTRPSASVPDEPESSPVRVEAPEPITETAAPEPELIELGEFKTTAYCTCVKCCGIWSADTLLGSVPITCSEQRAARFRPQTARSRSTPM